MTRHIKFVIFGCFCIVVLTLTVLFVEKRRSNYSVNIGDDGIITALFGSISRGFCQGLVRPSVVKSSIISFDDMLTLKSMIKGIADYSQEYPSTGVYRIGFQVDGETFCFSEGGLYRVPGLQETIEFLNYLSPMPIDLDTGP